MVPSVLDAVTTRQHIPTGSGSILHVEPSDIESLEVREAQEQDSAIGANVLLRSLQDAEKAGFTFDDEYVAIIKRYAHA